MLNDYCSNGQPSDQCLDVQAECDDTGTLRCLCKDGYYENSGSVCTQSKLSFFTETIIYMINICYSN